MDKYADVFSLVGPTENMVNHEAESSHIEQAVKHARDNKLIFDYVIVRCYGNEEAIINMKFKPGDFNEHQIRKAMSEDFASNPWRSLNGDRIEARRA